MQESNFGLIIGPCAIESYSRLSEVAERAVAWGVSALRGGIYKLRTHPDSFQGLRSEAFEIVLKVKAESGLPFISEVTDPRQIEDLLEVVDAFQVGARNMHNYELLKELGRTRKPILLKRGFSAYLDEFLLASEYILREGNSRVILCERGIRTFEPTMRNTLDLASIPYLKKKSGLPVYVDPSHATGKSEYVSPMCWAAAAAGADGLLIEVHPDPKTSVSDPEQALDFKTFESMLGQLKKILATQDRTIHSRLFQTPNEMAPEHGRI